MKKRSDGSSSRRVESSQQGLHERLADTVRKHLAHPFRKPYAAHNVEAFERANAWLASRHQPLILDSFCGVGESSWRLAERFPDCAVIGIDKSAARLDKHAAHRGSERDNYYLLRADVDDFWRLAAEAGWQPREHYLLYPNPWPKPGQLSLRVHGSPLFASLLALGGTLELRSNWPVYVQEFCEAMRIAGYEADCTTFVPDPALTPFERKYHAAGQTLWRARSAALSQITG